MITFARHVYHAGSRVGAARLGSWTKRQPSAASISRVAPAMTHHDPRTGPRRVAGGAGPIGAALTCTSLVVIGCRVGEGVEAGGRPGRDARACTGAARDAVSGGF